MTVERRVNFRAVVGLLAAMGDPARSTAGSRGARTMQYSNLQECQCTEALSSAECFTPVVNSARMAFAHWPDDMQIEMAAAISIAISRKNGDADGEWG